MTKHLQAFIYGDVNFYCDFVSEARLLGQSILFHDTFHEHVIP